MQRKHLVNQLRNGSGNVARVLMLVGFAALFIPTSSCAMNDGLIGCVLVDSVVSAVLALLGGRYWVLAGSVLLFLVAPMFSCV